MEAVKVWEFKKREQSMLTKFQAVDPGFWFLSNVQDLI